MSFAVFFQILVLKILLNGILSKNLNVSEWNKDVNFLCKHCLVIKDTEYLLYKCTVVENIWRKIIFFLGFEITWKIVTLGFHYEIKKIKSNKIKKFTFICFITFKSKMECRF